MERDSNRAIRPPFAGLATGSYCYFVHSYYVEPVESSVIATVTEYGRSFASAVWKDNVVACQFHPEKAKLSDFK